MRGHIRKRGSGYSVVVELPRGADGKRRQRWKSGFRTKREAQAGLTELLAEIQRGTYRDPSNLTVGEWLDRWLELAKPDLQPLGYEGYERHTRLHLKPGLGAIPLQRLTALQIEEFLAERRGVLAPSTLRVVRAVLGIALQRAEDLELIGRNPVRNTKAPQELDEATDAPVRTLTTEEAAQVLAAATGWVRVAVVLGISAGLRRGEVLGLRWKDVDLCRETLTGFARVRQSVKPTKNGLLLGPPKSKASRREISLTRSTVETLLAWKREQALHRLQLGKAWQDNDLILPDELGNVRHTAHLVRAWGKLAASLGINARFHDLRHTHATLLLEAGVADKVVSERLGHSSVLVTMNVYSHVRRASREAAATAMERAMQGLLNAG